MLSESKGFFRKEPGGPMKLMNDFFTTRPNRTILDSIDDYFREKLSVPSFPIEIKETTTQFIVIAELPGISKEHINAKILDDELIISVKKGTTQENASIRHLSGAERRVALPKHISIKNKKATYKNGLLTVRFPKKQGNEIEIE